MKALNRWSFFVFGGILSAPVGLFAPAGLAMAFER
jgi:hypothetical protein